MLPSLLKRSNAIFYIIICTCITEVLDMLICCALFTFRSGDNSNAVSFRIPAKATPTRKGMGTRRNFFSWAQYDISLKEETASTGILKYLITANTRSRISWIKLSTALFQGKLFTGWGALSQASLTFLNKCSNFTFIGSPESPAVIFMAHEIFCFVFLCTPSMLKLKA